MRLIDADKIVWRTQLSFNKTSLNVDFVFKQDIDAMPTVEAEPIRHGHWIVSGTFDDFLKCSECGFETPMWSTIEEKWTGCPVCLAKMSGEEKQENEKKEERNET